MPAAIPVRPRCMRLTNGDRLACRQRADLSPRHVRRRAGGTGGAPPAGGLCEHISNVARCATAVESSALVSTTGYDARLASPSEAPLSSLALTRGFVSASKRRLPG